MQFFYNNKKLQYSDIESGWNLLSPIPLVLSTRTSFGSSPTDEQIYINNSYFETTSYSKGGAISYDNGNYMSNLVVEYSIFNDCHTYDEDGGAIYMSGGNCAISKCCSHACSINDPDSFTNGHFIYIILSKTTKNIQIYRELMMSKIVDCSISYTFQTDSSAKSTIEFQNGETLITNTNISFNTCYSNSAFYGNPDTNGAPKTLTCSFSSLNNNTGSTCIGVGYAAELALIYKSNIIENTSPKSYIIELNCDSIIKECTLLGNSCKNLIKEYNSESITIVNCTVEYELLSAISSLNLSFWEPQPHLFINAIKCLNTMLCEAKYDEYESLTPNFFVKTSSDSCFMSKENDLIVQSIPFLFVMYIFSS